MISNQKEAFLLSDEVTYLNCAYMSPMLKAVEQAAQEALLKKRYPYQYVPDDFFDTLAALKQHYATIIDLDDTERLAMVPSVSYGLANVVHNIQPGHKKEIIVVASQFPSNVYPWMQLAKDHNLQLKMIDAPKSLEQRGAKWNERILEAIGPDTLVVTMGHVHWADGTLFDLAAIRARTRQHDALLIIDGTQSVGAMPFSIQTIQPDALVCAAYKWLLGPYSIGIAYYGPYFDQGTPIEHSWMNRLNSQDFQHLVNYQPEFRPKAARYNVGESSNFLLNPMFLAALEQIVAWEPANIQFYCQALIRDAIGQLSDLGIWIEEEAYRSSHLFGVYPPNSLNMERLKAILQEEQVYVSLRGDSIRIAPHLYNEAADLERLVDCFKQAMATSGVS